MKNLTQIEINIIHGTTNRKALEKKIRNLKGDIWFMECDLMDIKHNLPEGVKFNSFTSPTLSFALGRAKRRLRVLTK